MIPLELWNSEEMRKRRENAVAKALKEKPSVVLDAAAEYRAFRGDYYRVNDKYTVHTYMDADGQVFIECQCAASSPPIDERTGLPRAGRLSPATTVLPCCCLLQKRRKKMTVGDKFIAWSRRPRPWLGVLFWLAVIAICIAVVKWDGR